MEIKFECPQCGQHIAATAEQSGMVFPCPGCGTELTTPTLVMQPAESSPGQEVRSSAVPNPWLPRLALCFGAFGTICVCFGGVIPWLICGIVAVVLGTKARRQGRLLPENKTTDRMVMSGLVMGYVPLVFGGMMIGVSVLGLAVAYLFARPAAQPVATSAPATQSVPGNAEAQLTDNVQTLLNENKQKLFEQIHPVGTATGAKLHDVTITAWKHGQATGRLADVREFTIRYTLYWSGPMTKDGYTKVEETYDEESERYTSGRILATNGVTNKDAESAMGNVFTTWLQYQAQKAGAEQATREYYNQ